MPRNSSTTGKRGRAALSPSTFLEDAFCAVDGILSLLRQREVPATLGLVSRVVASALSASRIGDDVSILINEERLVELVLLAPGILHLSKAESGGGGPVVIAQVTPGRSKRMAATRLRSFRAAVSAAALRGMGDADNAEGSAHDPGGDLGTVITDSTFGSDSSSVLEGGSDLFPDDLANHWLNQAVADLDLEASVTKADANQDASAAPSQSDPSLLTISTRGLATRCGGAWPLVQRRVDQGLNATETLALAEVELRGEKGIKS